jgi:hypothetical protein
MANGVPPLALPLRQKKILHRASPEFFFCTGPHRVNKGKYRIGDDKRLLLMRVLRNSVMVRVGGGWENLTTYLTRRASRNGQAGDARKQARKTMEDILSTTGGTGLCSTRTSVRVELCVGDAEGYIWGRILRLMTHPPLSPCSGRRHPESRIRTHSRARAQQWALAAENNFVHRHADIASL